MKTDNIDREAADAAALLHRLKETNDWLASAFGGAGQGLDRWIDDDARALWEDNRDLIRRIEADRPASVDLLGVRATLAAAGGSGAVA